MDVEEEGEDDDVEEEDVEEEDRSQDREAHKQGKCQTGTLPDASDTTSIEHRALTVAVRTLQCGHTVCGI